MLGKIKDILPHLDAKKIASKMSDVIEAIPVVNIMPVAAKALSELPARWEAVPEEQKQALFVALVAAGTKAAANYAAKEQ